MKLKDIDKLINDTKNEIKDIFDSKLSIDKIQYLYHNNLLNITNVNISELKTLIPLYENYIKQKSDIKKQLAKEKLETFILPEKWFICDSSEYHDLLVEWMGRDVPGGFHYSRVVENTHPNWNNRIQINRGYFTELTIEQFKMHVMGKYPTAKDYKEKVIAPRDLKRRKEIFPELYENKD